MAEWIDAADLPHHDPQVVRLRPPGLLVPNSEMRGEGRSLNSDGSWAWSYMAPLQGETPDDVVGELKGATQRSGWDLAPAATEPPEGRAFELRSAAATVLVLVVPKGPLTIVSMRTPDAA